MRFFSLSIIICFSQMTLAVVGGISSNSAKSPDENLISRVTVAIIFQNSNGRHILNCSGVITGESEITTAGHCMDGILSSYFKSGQAFAEIYNPDTGKSHLIQIIDFRTAYDKKSQGGRDIALLKLAKSVENGVSVPLAIGPCDDSRRIAAGFGVTENDRVSHMVKLSEYSAVGVEEKARVSEKWSSKKSVQMSEGSISTSGKLCIGDSGGPVFCKVHGRLALTSIVSKNFPPPANVGSKTQELWDNDNVERCRQNLYMFGNRISDSFQFLLRWRQEFLKSSVSESDSEASVQR